jgi:hypothetical protein
MNNKVLFTTLSMLAVISIVLIIVATNISGKKDMAKEEDMKPVSTFDLNPSPKVSPTPIPEPEIADWRIYSNDQYNFSIEVPQDWYQEDYSSLYQTGGTVIAFSPTKLPCKTCTYFRDGYFSIKIFNQQTDPIFYTAFTERKNNLGKNKEYIEIQLDKKPGVYFANIADVENQGWVYEFSFDKDQGKANAIESKIFQHVLFTMKFTKLLFE